MLQLKNLKKWEEVEIVLRRHYIVYVMVWLYAFLWVIITISVFWITGITYFSSILMICFWLCFSMFLFIEWLNHELDLFVITNNRIIWIEQISFLDRRVSECNLGQVQEVNSTTSWFFANILNYWSIFIQTAWNATTLKMDFAPDSVQWARKILNIVDDYRDNQHLKVHEPTVDWVPS